MDTSGKSSTTRHASNLFSRLLTSLGRHELAMLVGVVLLAAGLWAFAEIADEVREGDTLSADRAILLSMRTADDASDPLGPRWAEELGRDLTALGGVGVLTMISLAVIGYLLLQRKGRAALFVLISVAGGLAVSLLLKSLFERARPDLVPHGSYVYTASFPSPHFSSHLKRWSALATERHCFRGGCSQLLRRWWRTRAALGLRRIGTAFAPF